MSRRVRRASGKIRDGQGETACTGVEGKLAITKCAPRPNPLDALAAGAQARKHVIERTVNEGRHGMSSSTARTAHSSRCASPAYPERVSAIARAHESGRSRRGGHFCKNNFPRFVREYRTYTAQCGTEWCSRDGCFECWYSTWEHTIYCQSNE